MPKRLIVCCDGTWNDPEDRTHIQWICQRCQEDEAEPLPQKVKYVVGVGTSPQERLRGGALGLGLSRNVRAAYRFVREEWTPGDELFVFGFSRGAYTARSLAGFIGRVGVLDSEEWVDRAYLWYRLAPRRDEEEEEPASVRRVVADILERLGGFTRRLGEEVQEHVRHRPQVDFLGVLDTVGSLGIPFRAAEFGEELGADLESEGVLRQLGQRLLDRIGGIEERVRRPIEGFHDTELGAHVRNAYHALAIDERRKSFLPTLWTAAPPTTTVEQAWFAGVHGDVGGSYRDRDDDAALAAIPLLWMLEKAAALGLDLKPGALEELRGLANPLAPQHDSMSPTWEVLGRVLRMEAVDRPILNAARQQAGREGRKVPPVMTNETIHPSVRRRLGQTVEVRRKGAAGVTRPYRPANLPAG